MFSVSKKPGCQRNLKIGDHTHSKQHVLDWCALIGPTDAVSNPSLYWSQIFTIHSFIRMSLIYAFLFYGSTFSVSLHKLETSFQLSVARKIFLNHLLNHFISSLHFNFCYLSFHFYFEENAIAIPQVRSYSSEAQLTKYDAMILFPTH